MKIIIKLAVFFIFFFLFFSIIFAQGDNVQVRRKEHKSPFKYVIVGGYSEIEKYIFENADVIEVLIDERAFNERNLKTLFKLLKKRFSNKEVLDIQVYTTLNQIRTPEENDYLNLWGVKKNVKQYKWAVFTKVSDREEIEYGIPGVIKSKTVVLSATKK